ncbi:cell division ATP-binding protein FtsE [Fulvivirga sedimenti]|uniref:Cell division ATP-binding protein FtsE n=1 Tax=Fulvivirga sedimenti TaxID=2879465 RepID=A0A9X1HK35_9BACT|nr:ATP-binding cassette domain-containing protein [Fulvivirga sedimenti]MCA6073588.1 ATP-binding cassette domain-containing protein [Fulvivirga sedimenti]
MQQDSDNVVIAKDITIFQSGQTILENVNFEIEKGEFVFVIGRTGGGKSSLLKTMYADLPLQVGHMRVAGFNIDKIRRSDVPKLRRKIGIIFQDFQLFTDRTVAENLMFVLKATGWKEKSKMKTRISEVLMQVGLGSMASKMPYQLSGGEQQRIVIARALLNEPVLLIADEPTGNLDPDVSQGIFKLFEEINNSGTAVIMATHDHELVKGQKYRILKCENRELLDSSRESFELSARSFH